MKNVSSEMPIGGRGMESSRLHKEIPDEAEKEDVTIAGGRDKQAEGPSDKRLRKVLEHVQGGPKGGVFFVGGLYGSEMASERILSPTMIERERSGRMEAALKSDTENGEVIVISHSELAEKHLTNSFSGMLRFIHSKKVEHPEAKIVVDSALLLKDMLFGTLQEGGHAESAEELLGIHGSESKRWLAEWIKTGGVKKEGEPDPAPAELEELFHGAFASLKGDDGRLLHNIPLSFAVRRNDPISILLLTYVRYGDLRRESISLTTRGIEPKDTSLSFVQIQGGKIGVAPQANEKVPPPRRF